MPKKKLKPLKHPDYIHCDKCGGEFPPTLMFPVHDLEQTLCCYCTIDFLASVCAHQAAELAGKEWAN